APERWFPDRLVRAPGLPGRHRAGWLYSARGLAMQGEGIGSDGRMYHFTGPYSLTWRNAGGRDTVPCPRSPGAWTNGRPAWIESGARFAPGASLPLAYWHAIARDARPPRLRRRRARRRGTGRRAQHPEERLGLAFGDAGEDV